jgi:hypothetical protein
MSDENDGSINNYSGLFRSFIEFVKDSTEVPIRNIKRRLNCFNKRGSYNSGKYNECH